jgi:hypothetical protein
MDLFMLFPFPSQLEKTDSKPKQRFSLSSCLGVQEETLQFNLVLVEELLEVGF